MKDFLTCCGCVLGILIGIMLGMIVIKFLGLFWSVL